MSVNTEPMNLKDAFAYMNFLSTSMQTARDLLSPVSPRLDVRTISSDNYLYTSRKVLRYSEVNSGMEDTQEDVEDLRSYSVTGDELILFLDEARRERERCALAISAAKQKLPRNLDLEISLNKERHDLIKKYRSLLDLRNLRRDYMDTSYKFDIDGRQTAYNVPATVISTISFDRNAVRSKAEELTQQAKAASAWKDKALVTTDVDFVPRWNISDEFETIVASVRE